MLFGEDFKAPQRFFLGDGLGGWVPIEIQLYTVTEDVRRFKHLPLAVLEEEIVAALEVVRCVSWKAQEAQGEAL